MSTFFTPGGSAQGPAFKPFTIDTVVDAATINGHKIKLQSIAVYETNLVVGTVDGQVCVFAAEKKGNKLEVKLSHKVDLKVGKKPVDQLLVSTSKAKVVALCDSTMVVLQWDKGTLKPAAGIPNTKGVQVICISSQKTQQQYCTLLVVKKKTLYVYELSDVLVIEKEVQMTEQVTALAYNNERVVFANDRNYGILDLETKEETQLMMYNLEAEVQGKSKVTTVQPLIHHLNEEEFLMALTGSERSSLGMIISTVSMGASRSTLQWSLYPNALGYRFPYVVAVLRSTVEVSSLVDQQPQQTLDIPGADEPMALCEGQGRTLYILTRHSILGLTMQTFDNQIDSLVKLRRIAKAADMIELYGSSENTRKTRTVISIFGRAAFSLIKDGAFEESVDFLKRGKVDVRLIIAMLPGISSSILVPADLESFRATLKEQYGVTESLDQIVASLPAPVVTPGSPSKATSSPPSLTSSSPSMVRALTAFASYLLYVRSQGDHEKELREEVDTTLLKIFADTDDPRLYSFLNEPNACLLEEGEDTLKSLQKYYAMALLNRSKSIHDKALALWVKLRTKEQATSEAEEVVGSLDELTRYMATLTDQRLLWKHADTVFQLDPIAATQMFLSKRDPPLDPLKVFEHLRKYGDDPVCLFLVYSIEQLESKYEQFHTELASIYMRKIQALIAGGSSPKVLDDLFAERENKSQSYQSLLEAKSATDSLSQARVTLLKFLKDSKCYRPALLLDSIQSSALLPELIVLYSKTGQHEKALEIMVFHMQDFSGAEDYCREPSNRDDPSPDDRQLTRDLYLLLLKVYINASSTPTSGTGTPNYPELISSLLNNQMTEMDVTKVLLVLPDNWQLSLVETFLTRTLRRNLHDKQEGKIVRSLYKGESIQVQSELQQLRHKRTVITESTLCAHCRKRIDLSVFARSPKGDIVHVHCLSSSSSSSGSS